MISYLKSKLKRKIEKTSWFESKIKESQFSPYIKEVNLGGAKGEFFFATRQSREWYDPVKPYTNMEYEWVRKNVNLKNKTIVDAGSHHGHYSTFFANAAEQNCKLISIDPYEPNNHITRINLILNNFEPDIRRCALSSYNGTANFKYRQNGQLSEKGSKQVDVKKIEEITKKLDVLKLDIEGEEFEVIKDLAENKLSPEVLIIEVHPYGEKNVEKMLKKIKKIGYKIMIASRKESDVIKYKFGKNWETHETIFGLKKS